MPAQVRHELDVTYSRYIPPVDPPQRMAGQRFRCVVSIATAVDTQTGTDAPLDIFKTASSNLASFQEIYLHRVSVWTQRTPSNPGTILVYPLQPGSVVKRHPSFRDTAGYDTGRARIGYYVPVHLSGPFTWSDKFVHVVSSEPEAWIEIDATFC